MQRHSYHRFNLAAAFRGVFFFVYAQNLNRRLVRNPHEKEFVVLFTVVNQQVVKCSFLFRSQILKPVELPQLTIIFTVEFDERTVAQADIQVCFAIRRRMLCSNHSNINEERMSFVDDPLV